MQNNCDNANVEYAGFWVRAAAYGIDMIIVTMALLIVRLLLSGVMALLEGTFLAKGILFHFTLKDIILYILQVMYFILFTYNTGTTLGKKAMNLQVVCADRDEKLTLLNVIYRETIGRFLCGFFAGIGYIIAGPDKEKRGLHDILCDTRVIYAKQVKVYTVYPKSNSQQSTIAPETQQTPETEYDFVPRMVEEEVEDQWNTILNKKKEES